MQRLTDKELNELSTTEPSNVLFEKGGKKICHCSEKEVVYVYPPVEPETARQLYSSNYLTDFQVQKGLQSYKDRLLHDVNVGCTRMKTYRAKCDIDAAWRWLDVGCGNGGFVIAAIKDGVDCYGSDMGHAFIDDLNAKPHLKHRFFIYNPEDDKPTRIYDAITLHDVIEHTLNPVKLLRNICSAFPGKGLLVLDTPDAKYGLDNNIEEYHHIRPVDHPFLYTINSLRAIVAAAFKKFEVVNEYEPIPGKIVGIYEIKTEK